MDGRRARRRGIEHAHATEDLLPARHPSTRFCRHSYTFPAQEKELRMAAVIKEENNGFEGRRKRQNSYFVPLETATIKGNFKQSFFFHSLNAERQILASQHETLFPVLAFDSLPL